MCTHGCRGVDPEQHQGVGLRYPSQRTLDSELGGTGNGHTHLPSRKDATEQVCLLQGDVDVHVCFDWTARSASFFLTTCARRRSLVSSVKLRFHMQTRYPQLQVSRWPSPSQETRPPSRRCSRGALDLKEAGVQQSENRWMQASTPACSCVPLQTQLPSLLTSRLQTFSSGWRSTSRPCSGARPSCTGTLAKAHSDMRD